MNSTELLKLAQRLKTDPRFSKLINGQTDIASLVSDPQIQKAVNELASEIPADPQALANELLQGKDGDKIKAVLDALQK